MTKYEFSYARRIFDGVAGATARKSNEADGNIIEIVGTVNHPNMNLNDEEFAENKKALYLLKSLTEVGVKRKSEEWPPACFGLLHQPKRPKKK